MDLWYGATGDLEWYDPVQVITRDGALVITMDSINTTQSGLTPGKISPSNKKKTQLIVKRLLDLLRFFQDQRRRLRWIRIMDWVTALGCFRHGISFVLLLGIWRLALRFRGQIKIRGDMWVVCFCFCFFFSHFVGHVPGRGVFCHLLNAHFWFFVSI